jgi:hypothetical protein
VSPVMRVRVRPTVQTSSPGRYLEGAYSSISALHLQSSCGEQATSSLSITIIQGAQLKSKLRSSGLAPAIITWFNRRGQSQNCITSSICRPLKPQAFGIPLPNNPTLAICRLVATLHHSAHLFPPVLLPSTAHKYLPNG